MKWYAEDGAMRTRQQLLDVGALAFCYVFMRLGQGVHGTVLRLQEPGRQLADAGNGLAGGLGDAANSVGGTPLVGDKLSAPLNVATEASRAVAAAGLAGQDAVGAVAVVLGLIVALLPIAYLISRYLPHRLQYAREAGAADVLRGDVELLALRAASTLPLSTLARLGPEPVGRWRRGEPGSAEALARLELATMGLLPDRAPKRPRRG